MSDERFVDYDRVTDILAPFAGYGHIDPEILKRAADRGTKVHNAIDIILKDNQSIEYDPFHDEKGIEGYLQSFRRFWDKYDPFVLAQEQRLFDQEHAITGKVDLVAVLNNNRVLIDWKTSARFNRTWPLQGAAYASLLEDTDLKVDHVLFVKLSKKGDEPEIFEFDANQYLGQFDTCLWCYREFFKNMLIPIFED